MRYSLICLEVHLHARLLKQLRELLTFTPQRVDLGKRRKARPGLFEAGSVLPVSQQPIGLQGSRERKTPRIETHGRCPGEERPPGALISPGAVGRKVAPSRPFEEIGEKPSRVYRVAKRNRRNAGRDHREGARPRIPLRRARRDAKTRTENLSWPTRQRQLALCVASSTHYHSAVLAPFPEKVLTIWMAWE